ncbi:MAG: DUF624 domain-containing protein [Candidatus Dormibacteraeota bacterium]|nr:DUF624 domain-containing protein [Candidatus Dormibacteraeota bacterium]MBO0745184.1 DUF624 domain-containing protein [Candidatus Dormibacteraeota bacterium]
MGSRGTAEQRFGQGPLSRASALVYTLLVTEVLLLLATAPGILAALFVRPDPSNAPLLALCALPLGPALAAAMYTLHRRRRDLAELHPAADFWRGYRTSLRGALLVWVPALAWLTVVATVLSHLGAAGVPRWWAGLLLLSAAAVALWALGSLQIVALFSFRARDIGRLGAYALARRPLVTLGNLGLLIAAALVVLLTSEAVLALLGSILLAALVRTSRPVIADIESEFTA